MHRNPLANLLMLTLLVIAGARCTKHAEGTTGAAGPAGSTGATGAGVKPSPITGYIDLLDPYGNPFPYSPGVNLWVLSQNKLVTTTTDSTGKFAFPPLPPGNYDIHVTKTGFDSLQLYVQHAGGDEAKFIGATQLVQTSTTKIISQSVAFQPDPNNPALLLTTNFTVTPGTGTVERDFIYYFSHSHNVSSVNADRQYSSGYSTNSSQFTLNMLLSNLTQYSNPLFHSGDSVYVLTVVAHPFSVLNDYFDYTDNKYVPYPSVGDSAATSFKMP